ncbi:hypothetical protein B0A55_06360 [Friedmanniomyces simplex]|uniref:Copper acquisition factor BIM1-like domain-containing protein n=1 Tax=Friedmanniomyces simplex TaxID=329884 RepID=A0A4U0XAE2_9PEZI|nr:hypothetical protein B0A55_06360 [Friedmanniomyces simplex]
MLSRLLFAAAGASLISAHFILQWPETAGFDDDAEPQSPCGGATAILNSTSPQIHVEQFAISILSTHPEAEWQFRATTDTQPPYNFTDIVPVVNSTGIGSFCLPSMSAPAEFAGHPGVIQVIDNSVDGVLYQCAPVNFVSGANSTLDSACTNATGFTASWTSLESIDGSDSSASGTMASMTGSTTGTASSTASSTESGTGSASSVAAAAIVTGVSGILGGLGLLAAGLAL